MEYYVHYTVPGQGVQQAGPYATAELAEWHRADIAGYGLEAVVFATGLGVNDQSAKKADERAAEEGQLDPVPHLYGCTR